MSSPLSSTPTAIPFWNRNQVMFGGGIDLAQHVKLAVSPTSSGPLDWGSLVMLTTAASKRRQGGTNKITEIFHITIHYYSHPSCTLSLAVLSNPLSPTQKYSVKSSSPVTLTERTLRVVKLSSGCNCDIMLMSSPLSSTPTAIPFWNWNQVMFGDGIDLAWHVNMAISPTSTGPVGWGSSVMLTMAAGRGSSNLW